MAKIRRRARLVQRVLQDSATLPPVAPLYQPVIWAELASKFRRITQTKASTTQAIRLIELRMKSGSLCVCTIGKTVYCKASEYTNREGLGRSAKIKRKFNLLTSFRQKSSSCWTWLSNMSLECQSWRDSIFRYIAFVIYLQILPNTKLYDIIKPATEASFRAVIVVLHFVRSASASISVSNLMTLLAGIFRTWFNKSQSRPSQMSCWVGDHWHLSQFGTKPLATRSARTDKDCFVAASNVELAPKPSSKYTTILMALLRQCLTRGLITLVKIYGPVDRPNGKTVNTKYRGFESNTHANPRNCWSLAWISMWWYPDLISNENIQYCAGLTTSPSMHCFGVFKLYVTLFNIGIRIAKV